MRFVQFHSMRRPQPGKADRVRPDVVMLLQVQGMGNKPQDLEPPVVQPEQCADTHVVALGLHRPGYAVEPPEIIPLARVGRMHAAESLVVVGFLEYLVRSDAGFLDG